MPKKTKDKEKTIQTLVRVSTDSLFKHTGRHWDDWISILEKVGAFDWTHQETVAYLKKKQKLTPWWQQMVSHGYEVHSGKKIEGQNKAGLYSLTATKSCPVSQKAAWKFMTSQEGLRLWINPMSEFKFVPKSMYEVEGGIFGEIRTMKSPVRARLTWRDLEWEKASIVQLYIAPKPKNKSLIVIMHDNLKSTSLREEMRVHWKTALARIVKVIKE